MKQGYGSPYIKAFTSLGEVRDRITDFSYKFSQKGDDVCTMRIEGDDELMPDFPIYQEGVQYTMIWGYIGETESQKRLVILRNIKVSYTEEGIALDLLFTDKASLIKTNSSKRVYNKATVKDVVQDVANRNGLLAVGTTGPTSTPNAPPTNSNQTTANPEDSGGVTQIFNDFVDGVFDYFGINSLFDDDTQLRQYETLPQANKSDYEVVKEAADNDPSGPYEVVGRDNALIVHKPNFNQKPIRSYKWKGEDGHLLRFTPESKEYFVGAGHLGIGVTSMNPFTKVATETVVTEGNNGMTHKLAPVIATPNYDNKDDGTSSTAGTNDASTPTKKPTPVKEDPAVKDKKLRTIATNEKGNKAYSPQKQLGFEKERKETFKGRKFVFTDFSPASDIKADKLSAATSPLVTPVPYTPTFLTGQHTPSTDDEKNATGKAASVQNKKSLEKNPANAKIVGNVLLESGKVLTIEHIAKKFSGNYYVNECTHRINPGTEYYCDLELVRNAQGKISKPGVNTTDASNKYSKRGAKNEVNTQTGPEDNQPKTKTVPSKPADKPNPVLQKYKFRDTPGNTGNNAF